MTAAACAAAFGGSIAHATAAKKPKSSGLTGPTGALHGCLSTTGVLKVIAYKAKCHHGTTSIYFGATGATGAAGAPADPTQVQQLQSEVTTLQSDVRTLTTDLNTLDGGNDALLAGVSRTSSGNTLLFSGMNLQLESGLGDTYTTPTNGLGNLIIGYNESPGAQTGSANLVLGDRQTFTSWGGILAGDSNTISGPAASVIGGIDNTASGAESTVTGGRSNAASNTYASVDGGNNNAAAGNLSVVSEGSGGTASGPGALVAGGQSDTNAAADAVIAGGDNESLSSTQYEDAQVGGTLFNP